MTNLPRPAPDFALPADDGSTVSRSSLAGAPFVLFFYPRDNTPGCTTEAKAFSALKPEFDALGIAVYGVSKDSLKSHAGFRAKQGLTVGLLSDAGSDASEAFGVWQLKKLYGREFMGLVRSTFLVDAAGQIVVEWPKVKVAGHAEAVLDAARAL